MKSGIYQIRNTINNDIYVGSAINLVQRKCQHFSNLKNNCHHSPILQRAYIKYKHKNFVFEVLEKCYSNKLIDREQYYLDTLQPKYNICKVAHSTLGLKLSTRKRVIQYDLQGNIVKTWESLTDIMEEFKIPSSTKISLVCRGKRNKAYGYVWRFEDEFIPFTYTEVRKGKSIAEIDEYGNIITTWNRIKDCAEDVGCTSAKLCNILSSKSRMRTHEGRLFKRI